MNPKPSCLQDVLKDIVAKWLGIYKIHIFSFKEILGQMSGYGYI